MRIKHEATGLVAYGVWGVPSGWRILQRGRLDGRPREAQERFLRDHRVRWVVGLAPKTPNPVFESMAAAGEIHYIHHPIPDGLLAEGDAAYLDEVAARVAAGLSNGEGGSVLSHCLAGRNRSGLVNALILRHLVPGLSGAAAVDVVRKGRERALTNEVFVRHLEALGPVRRGAPTQAEPDDMSDELMERHGPSGLWVRRGSMDHLIIEDQPRAWKDLVIEPGARALDIGGHIGSFARWALDRGAGFVASVEPEPVNFAILERNLSQGVYGARTERINAACTREGGGTVEFWVSPKEGYLCSTVEKRGYRGTRVATEGFVSLLERTRPDILKVDCEGAEYEFLLYQKLPPSVTQVGIEFHLGRREWRHKLFPALVAWLERLGFQATRPINLTTGWHVTVAVFRRR